MRGVLCILAGNAFPLTRLATLSRRFGDLSPQERGEVGWLPISDGLAVARWFITSPRSCGERSSLASSRDSGEGRFATPMRFAIPRVLCLLAFFLLTPLTASASLPFSDADILAAAERAFAEGMDLRDDEAKARPAFSRAADGYDELWQRGHHNPELALNRAAAHRLAGNLPRAIVALNEGLAVTRWSRALQVALEDVRAAVAYPVNSDLAEQCRPAAPSGLGTRFSPGDVWVTFGVLWLFACAALARFAMTRAPGWLGFGVLCVGCLVLLGAFWLKDQRRQQRENESPLVVVAREVTMRKGNADAFPVKLTARLPRGVEARKLVERGGWVQVRLASGTVGWIPVASLVKSES